MVGLAAVALVLGVSAGCGARSAAPRSTEPAELLTCTDYASPSHIPFACRESELHRDDRPVVEEMAAYLLSQRGLTRVRLVGAQSRTGPEGALPADLALRRAATVRRELERSGIDPALISIVAEESGYRHKSGRRKNEPDTCTDELFDRRRSRSVEIRYTLCCPPERAVTRLSAEGPVTECPFTPRPD